ncbi:unnamed protein product [Acanthoscelides obtectus]|nr:unnamed protein product [Acanthoscelides obtectus]CAK1688245.1 Cytochrome P450 4C1 [Acanthoscelides obtectus]
MRVVGPDKNIEYNDVPKLEYTERVVKESLRLFPVLAMVGRHVVEDVVIGNYVAPAGTCLVFPILHMHRSEEHWKDPLKFDPDRFLPENMADRHPLTYFPFSFGVRNCIGWKYAMMSQTVLLAHVIRKLRIFTEYKSIEEVETELHAFTRIKGGPKVFVKAR